MRSRANHQPVHAPRGVFAIFVAAVAAQMHKVCDRLPVPVAQAALARYGFVEACVKTQ